MTKNGSVLHIATQYSYANTPKITIDNNTYELVATAIKIQSIYFGSNQYIFSFNLPVSQRVIISCFLENGTIIGYKVNS